MIQVEYTKFESDCIESIAEVLQFLSGKWTILVITELLKEPQRFTDKGAAFSDVFTHMNQWKTEWESPSHS